MAGALKYRPEIDGLRAIAIIAVVACHVGLPGFAGGFVGVDVFFVISGFLITSILLRNVEKTGRIDLVDFYARRMRRIVPALAVVVVVTLAAGAIVLTPTGEQQKLAASGLATSGFASNLYFLFARAGYFADPAQFLPLLHTWSLGVEEQFYIGWPLALAACLAVSTRLNKSLRGLLWPLLTAGAAASLIGCIVVMDRAEGIAFYFSPFRAWELGAGALLATLPAPRKDKPLYGDAACALGLILIFAAILLYAPKWMFVGAGLVAVAGSVFVIAGTSAAPGGAFARILGSAPLVAVGKVSYSWYLLHWPMLALVRAQDLGAPSLLRDCLIAAVAFLIAALSWRFVEQPVLRGRVKPFISKSGAIATGLLLLAICAGASAGLWAWAQSRATSSPTYAAVRLALEPISLPVECDRVAGDIATVQPVEACLRGDTASDRMVVLWGDSHARHLVPGLDASARESGVALMPYVKSGCRAFVREPAAALWTPERRIERCAQYNRAAWDQIQALKARGLTGVILASRWSRPDGWEADMGETLRLLTSHGLRVLVVADAPIYAASVPQCIARRGVEACRTTRKEVEETRRLELAKLSQITSSVPGVRLWDLATVLCPGDRCEIVGNGKILYSDAHHLTHAGSMYLTTEAASHLAWLSGRTD